jgi:hypothetical protein
MRLAKDGRFDALTTGSELSIPVLNLDSVPKKGSIAYELPNSLYIGDGDSWNQTGGGGGAATLQVVTDLGNTTTNDIALVNNAAVRVDNGSMLKKGTINAGLGGANGISQFCSIGYELKWEAGRLYVMGDGGIDIRQSLYNFLNVPTNTDDDTKGYMVGSLWSLDDGTIYVCSDTTTGAAVWTAVPSVPKRLTVRVVQTEGDDNLSVLTITNTTSYTFSGITRTTPAPGVIAFRLDSTVPIVGGQFASMLSTNIRDNDGIKSMIDCPGVFGDDIVRLDFSLRKFSDDSYTDFYASTVPPGGTSPPAILEFVFS